MRDAADGGVHARAAEGLLVGCLTGGSLDEVGPAETHKAGLVHHDEDIAQSRQVRATCDAWTHHGGDLRHTELAPHDTIVVKNAACAILSGKDAVLVGKIDAGGIDQVDDGHRVAHGNLLGAQNLGDGFRPPGSCLHRCVVGDDDG